VADFLENGGTVGVVQELIQLVREGDDDEEEDGEEMPGLVYETDDNSDENGDDIELIGHTVRRSPCGWCSGCSPSCGRWYLPFVCMYARCVERAVGSGMVIVPQLVPAADADNGQADAVPVVAPGLQGFFELHAAAGLAAPVDNPVDIDVGDEFLLDYGRYYVDAYMSPQNGSVVPDAVSHTPQEP
jgi:hypothetical protein